MNPARALTFAFALLSTPLAAQNTWTVNPNGSGDFTSLASAQAGATDGDTLVLVGQLSGITMNKRLHLAANLATVFGVMRVEGQGPVSIGGGVFGRIVVDGTTTSLDGVTTNLEIDSGATVAARGCDFAAGVTANGAVTVRAGCRAIFDVCTFDGRDAFGVVGLTDGTAAADVFGHAEFNGCTLAGGDSLQTPGGTVPGGPAIALAGSVDLRECLLSGETATVITGAGQVRHENTFVGTPNVAPGVQTVAASLPWMFGSSSGLGGTLQVSLDGPAATLALIAASVGMSTPMPSPLGDVWLSANFVPVVAGITDQFGRLDTLSPVPVSAQRGLQVTFQGIVAPLNGPLQATRPAVLQVL